MPDSMYDRLGDMLSDALDSGIFFAEKHKSGKETQENVEKKRQSEEKSTAKTARKDMPSAVKTALALLGLDENATIDEAKKAYHEKLKYYHPDRHGTNPVLQKVARDKTRQVIEAWNVINAE